VAEKTRGGLVPAMITECEQNGNQVRKKSGSPRQVVCMFNPYEYTVKKSNTYKHEYNNERNVPTMEFSKAGEKTLTLKLSFDTYEAGQDVSQRTRVLWELMNKIETSAGKQEPPPVVFEWGVFEFFAVIKSVSQKFTMFLHDGTPVRAEVDITLSQHMDSDEYRVMPAQNPTSGNGTINRVWLVQAGDRLDLIAADVYGDATKWRIIAQHNDIMNPFLLTPGIRLTIPDR
jgi:phage protein U